jgi:hypothetical protein
MIHDRSKTKLVVPDDHLHVATILFHGDTATSSDLLQRDEKEEEEERKREREREREGKKEEREKVASGSFEIRQWFFGRNQLRTSCSHDRSTIGN